MTKTVPKIICIGSGKGGVGKTLTSALVSWAFSQKNLKVLLIDGDINMANLDILLGIQPSKNLFDLTQGQCTLKETIVEMNPNFHLLPSSSGVKDFSKLNDLQKHVLWKALQSSDLNYDYIFIDTPAGINETVLHFHAAAHYSVIVTTPEPHSMTDAYGLMKVLREETQRKKFFTVINQVKSPDEGRQIFLKLDNIVSRFLNAKLESLGTVQMDATVQKGILSKNIFKPQLVHSICYQNWFQVARELYEHVSIHGTHAVHGDEAATVGKFFESLIWPKEGFGYESTRQAV